MTPILLPLLYVFSSWHQSPSYRRFQILRCIKSPTRTNLLLVTPNVLVRPSQRYLSILPSLYHNHLRYRLTHRHCSKIPLFSASRPSSKYRASWNVKLVSSEIKYPVLLRRLSSLKGAFCSISIQPRRAFFSGIASLIQKYSAISTWNPHHLTTSTTIRRFASFLATANHYELWFCVTRRSLSLLGVNFTLSSCVIMSRTTTAVPKKHSYPSAPFTPLCRVGLLIIS